MKTALLLTLVILFFHSNPSGLLEEMIAEHGGIRTAESICGKSKIITLLKDFSINRINMNEAGNHTKMDDWRIQELIIRGMVDFKLDELKRGHKQVCGDMSNPFKLISGL